ncbi:MAG: C25 family cysteine peptidase [Bacteroidia bacterium]|nr:C25 family cysteine peptidase [Bacteroidia bacterium]
MGRLSLVLGLLWAQGYEYGNGWIEAGAPYLKLLVGQDGVYRITAAQLGLNGVPSATLRLFWRGTEIPIYVEDGGDGQFEANDYLEFVGQRNDGEPDTVAFRHAHLLRHFPGLAGNPRQSLNHNDTSAYFLTWGGRDGLRLVPYNDPNALAHPRQDWFWWRQEITYHPGIFNYWTGAGGLGSGGYEQHNNPMYIAGEGRGRGMNPLQISFTLPEIRPDAAPSFAIELSHAALSIGGTFNLEWRVNNTLIANQTSTAPYYFRPTFTLSTTLLSSPLTVVCRSSDPGYGGELVHYGAVVYPRGAVLSANEAFLKIGVRRSSAQPITLVLSNVPIAPGDSLLVYDVEHRWRWRAVSQGTQWYIPLPPLADTFALYLCRGASVQTPLIQQPVLENYSQAAGASVILITHRSLAASAQAYKAYRETSPTNPHSVFIAYTDAIYDEFGWGRVNHPLAIRNFIRWALDRWSVRPRYVLIWGDGVGFWRVAYNSPLPPYHKVPFFGLPASDWGYVSDFYGDGNVVPEIPIGRVPVHTDAQGLAYVEKVRQYESRPNEPWHKWALHLGGGADAIEQALIEAQLRACQQIFEGSPYHGQVVYYQRRTDGMQAPPGSPSIKERMDSGVVVLQGFGHSAFDIFDISLYDAQDYDNWGRYPLLILNGCYQGSYDGINQAALLHGERFVLEPGRGCLWYLSGSGSGFVGPLGRQTVELYAVLFRDSLGITMGDALVAVFRRLFGQGTAAFDYYHLAGQPLLGDPCVRLAGPRLPDLAIRSGDIQVIPLEPSAESPSFSLRLRYSNLGIAFHDSFWVEIVHRVSSTSQTFTYRYRRPAFARVDSLEVVLPSPVGEWAGINEIEVYVDAQNDISNEAREDNNRARVEFFVRSARPIPIYPWPYAVISKSRIALVAATYNQSIYAPQGYYFEIDTSYRFDSPGLRRSGRIQGSTALGRWELPFELEDSVVYYWRVRLEGSGQQEWAEASFQYIAGDKEGWGQSGRAQFLENELRGLRYSAPGFRWEFAQRQVRIRAVESYGPYTIRRFLERDDEVLSGQGSYTSRAGWWWGARPPGIFVGVFDPQTFEPLESIRGLGGWRYFCSGGPCHMVIVEGGTSYWVEMDAEAMAESLRVVVARAPVGAPVVLLFTTGHQSQHWPARLAQVLPQIGATSAVLALTPTQKAILIGVKGAPVGTAVEVFCDETASCAAERFFEANYPLGWMVSPRIGRPVAWEEAFFAYQPQDPSDQITMNVYGLRPEGGWDTLCRQVAAQQACDLRPYNASHTELRLEARFSDPQHATAPQLAYWYVFFRPFPDIAVDPGLRWRFVRDTLEEGEWAELELGVRNLLSADTPDSVEVVFLLQRAGGWDTIGWQRYAPLQALDSMIVRWRFSTVGLGGLHRLRLILNPRPLFNERTFANNRWEVGFFVRVDRINPIVDVLFDGIRIQNGDIVSPEPTITIDIKDENRYLLLDDTSVAVVRLRRAEARGLGERINYASGKLRFLPATPAENRAGVEFRPGHLEDGDYILSVEAFDKKRNRSGFLPYEVRFRVINQSTVTHVVNYPNPFSTSTRFYYELTGAVLPEVFQIHIYTVSGRLVKVIDLKALGEVRIGRHLTNYAWDGTDEYGDRLANGVYLYRVVLRMPEGHAIEQREEGMGRYFRGGWGKMVLMR